MKVERRRYTYSTYIIYLKMNFQYKNHNDSCDIVKYEQHGLYSY